MAAILKPDWDEDSTESRNRFCKKNIDTKELIELVKAKKCLWDRSCTEYRDKCVKEKAWNEIYKEVVHNIDSVSKSERYEIGAQITRKWYNIRDSYVKSRRPGRYGYRNRRYLYAELLTFLDPIYFGDETMKAFEEKRYNEDGSNNDDEEEENGLSEVFVDIDESAEEIPAKRVKLEYGNPKEPIEPDDNIVSVLASLIQKEEDEDRAFFKSIVPSVKALSDDSKLEFRIQVMKLLKVLKSKEKENQIKTERSTNASDSE